MDDSFEIMILQNPSILSIHELSDAYQKLSICYSKQKNLLDQQRQQIYSLKQDKSLKDKILQEELELIKENYDHDIEKTKKKHLLKIEELQNRLMESRLVSEKLELENQSLKNELKLTYKQSKKPEFQTFEQHEITISNNRNDYLNKIEVDYAMLVEDMVKLKLENSQLMSKVMDREV